MIAKEFPEVNVRIAENQDQYETLPVHVASKPYPEIGLVPITMCFELNEEEKKQVAETGQLWFTVLQGQNTDFSPIRMSTLKPEMK